MLQFLGIFVASLLRPTDPAGPPAPGEVAVVPNFTLKDIHRRPRSLDDFKDKKAVAIIFIDAECPVAGSLRADAGRTAPDVLGKGRAVPGDRLQRSRRVRQRLGLRPGSGHPFPVLKDFDQQVADDFGAGRTPEVFVLDADRVIRYRGRIDDQYGVGSAATSRRRATSRRPLTSYCRVNRHGPAHRGRRLSDRTLWNHRAGNELTYARDVAAIVQKRCQECHRPGEIGPFSLLTYHDAAKRTSRIREAVLEERMPPWHADPRYGHFANDRALSQDERDTLLAWIDQGAPKGDDNDLPPPLKFTQGWKIGEPDKVYLDGQRIHGAGHGRARLPAIRRRPWLQGRRLGASRRVPAGQPESRSSYHCLCLASRPARTLRRRWHGGHPCRLGPRRHAGHLCARHRKACAPGSRLVFEVHYTPNGTEQTDRSSIGIKFAPKPPANAVETNILANMVFRIPPGPPTTRAR